VDGSEITRRTPADGKFPDKGVTRLCASRRNHLEERRDNIIHEQQSGVIVDQRRPLLEREQTPERLDLQYKRAEALDNFRQEKDCAQ
jgi:hypothetical protein